MIPLATSLAILFSMSAPAFDQHPVAPQVIDLPAAPDYSSAPEFDWLEARLAGYRPEQANFAGRFAVLTTGCGTGCQAGAVLDLSDGSLHALPQSASAGYDYRVDSTLLIVNPASQIEDAYGPERPSWLHSYAYLWDASEDAFVLLWTDDPEVDRASDDD